MSDQLLDLNGPAFYRAKNELDAMNGLVRLARLNEPHMACRRSMAAKYASVNEGMTIQSLAAYGYTNDATHYFTGRDQVDVPLIRQTCNSATETFVSWIGSLDNPKPAFVTTKGKWSDKRKAEKLKQMVEAGYRQKQGRFFDTPQLCRHALRMAVAATGSVAVKVQAYPNEKRVSKELHDTLSMFFDYGEAEHCGFITLGEKTWFDPDRLMEIFPGYDDLIAKNMKAPPQEFNVTGAAGRVKKLVCLYEGWRSMTADAKGVYLAGMEDGTCFSWDDYDYDSPPFAWLHCNPRLWGPLGMPMTHYIYESCRRENLILASIDRSVSKSFKQVSFADLTNLVNPSQLDQVEDNTVIELNSMSAGVPQFVVPMAYHPSMLTLANQHTSDAYQDAGISEAKAGSKAEAGVDSAIGQRNVAAFLNKRYAATQVDFVNFEAVDLATLEIRAMKEVAKHDPKFALKWPGKKFLLEIDAEVLDLPDSMYVIQPEAVGGIKDTPADRLQTASELKDRGILSDVGFASAQQDYDTPGHVDEEDEEYLWLQEQMYSWAFASDKEFRDPDFYKGPIKFMDLDRALSQCIKGLTRAQMDDLEPERQELFMMFLADLDAAMRAKAAFMRELAGPTAPTQLPPPQVTG